jgi:hypothetical protein
MYAGPGGNLMNTNVNEPTTTKFGVKFPIRKVVGYEIINNETIPTIKIAFDNGGGYYLQPFRKYCFQVSGTIDGEGDYGSSNTLPYENLKDLPVSTTTAIITDAAKAAIKDFESRNSEWVISNVSIPRRTFAKFIDDCHMWIYGKKSDYIV